MYARFLAPFCRSAKGRYPPNCDMHSAIRNVRFTSTPGDHRQDNVRLRLFNLEELAMDEFKIRRVLRPWNKGKLVGGRAN